MYDNIGEKIKSLALLIFIIGVIVSVVAGVAILLLDGEIFIVLGILIIATGSFIAWISSCFAYGFGELIDKTGETKAKSNYKIMDKTKISRSLHHIDDEDD